MNHYNTRHDKNIEKEYLLDLLSIDYDGYGFVDYFNIDSTQFDSEYDWLYYMGYLRDLIIKNIKNYDKYPSVKKKNTWMKNKFNQMIIVESRLNRLKIILFPVLCKNL